MTQPIHQPNRRFESLDSLRAIACLFVIWQHVSEYFLHTSSGGSWASSTADYFDFGRIGVIAFFCISGFVIPSSLRGNRMDAAKSFIVNRFFRLYPLYWISMALAAIFVWKFWGLELSGKTFLHNITMVAELFGSPHLLGLYWTLELELIFYFACTLLYLGFGRINFWAIALAFTISTLETKFNFLINQSGYLPQLGFLLSIMFMASAWRIVYDLSSKGAFNLRKGQHLCYLLITIFMTQSVLNAPIRTLIRNLSDSNLAYARFGYGHLLGLLIFFAFTFFPKSLPLLARIGRATYSAYLLHPIVFNGMKKFVESYELPGVRLEIYIIVATAITIPLSLLTYRYIEQPCIGFAKRLTRKWKPSASPSQPD